MKKLIVLFVAFFLVISCAEEEPPQNTNSGGGNNSPRKYNVPAEYRGQWVYAHSGVAFFLGATTEIVLEYTDRNIITIKSGSNTGSHLVRAGSSNIQLHGVVSGLASASAARTGEKTPFALGGMDVILKNITDPNIQKKIKTDNNGDFVMDGVPNGSYEVNVGGSTIKTELNDSDNDIGIITVTNDNGCNFKSSVNMTDRFLYGNHTTYNGNVRIENIGKSECLGISYNISVTDPYVHNFTFTNNPGTILPGRYRDIPITISFKFLDEPENYVTLDIELRDVRGTKWNDKLRLKVFRSAVRVNFDSVYQLRGRIIIPGHSSEGFSTNRNTQLVLPEIPGKEHIIVLSNPNINNETFYSIGFGVPADNASLLTDNVDKGNNSTDSATMLNTNDTADGYLYMGALHTFKAVMGKSNKAVDLSIDGISKFRDVNSNPTGVVGNGDGVLNKGEIALFNVGIRNIGAFTANSVSTRLSVDDPYVTIENLCNNVFSITGGEARDTRGYSPTSSSYLTNTAVWSQDYCFRVTTLNTTPDNHKVVVTATMTDSFSNTWTDTFDMVVGSIAANLSIVAISEFRDTNNSPSGAVGNGDRILNKGETAFFNIGIQNTGSSGTNLVSTTLSVNDPYITITKESTCSSYSVSGGQMRDTNGNLSTSSAYLGVTSSSARDYCFRITTLDTTPDNHTAAVTTAMTDLFGNTWVDTFDIVVSPISANLSVVGVSEFRDVNNSPSGAVGNGNRILNKGETAFFNIGIQNSGSSVTNSVSTTLSVNDPYITIIKNGTCSAYNISGEQIRDTGGNLSTSSDYLKSTGISTSSYCFRITALNTTPDNHTVAVTATMTDMFTNTWTDTFDITVFP